MEEIRLTYKALANYLQLATGSGEGTAYNFDLEDFCNNYKLKAITTFNCLKFIERQGYIALTDALYQPSRIKFELNRDDLYKFQISNTNYDSFIRLLLRSYSGLFDSFVKINELDISKKAASKHDDVIKRLNILHQHKVITYIAQTTVPQLTFIRERINARDIEFSNENFYLLKERAEKRAEAMLNYAESKCKCRSKILLAYFDETNTNRCNQCDICLEENRTIIHTDEFEKIAKQIKQLLEVHSLTLKNLVDAIVGTNDEKKIHVIKWMIDNNRLKYENENLFIVNE